MEPIKSLPDLVKFILKAVKRFRDKKEDELQVGLSFGVALSGDELEDIESFMDYDNRFSQNEMNDHDYNKQAERCLAH